MRSRQWLLAIGAAGALSFAVLEWRADAQTPPAAAFNPTLPDCNTTPDTLPNPADKTKPIKTPIDSTLLTSGQPCQQRVSTAGLILGDKLGNLQRGFDFYSWLTFIALNSPADGKTTIGKGPRAGGDAKTRWEALNNYRPLADVMLDKGAKPEWGTRLVPDLCKPLDGPDKIILKLGEAAWNQPFKTGPLIDQKGNYALFDILMNEVMFRFISDNGLYSKQGQERFHDDIAFPKGKAAPTIEPVRSGPGEMGAVMVKVSWRILDPVEDATLIERFHTVDALVYFPGGAATRTGPACVAKKLGMVGFHVGHKTDFAPQWVWSSFEHISNAPDAKEVAAKDFHPPYNFYDPACQDNCPRNTTLSDPWDPPASLKFHTNEKSQVVREKMLPDDVATEVADLNDDFRALVKGTVWGNYALVATQWPSDFASKTDCNGAPAPMFLANTTLETYSQGHVPLASSSCMACHGNAATQHVPATPSDFTFILEKAQCEKGVCGSPPPPPVPVVMVQPTDPIPRCGLAKPPK